IRQDAVATLEAERDVVARLDIVAHPDVDSRLRHATGRCKAILEAVDEAEVALEHDPSVEDLVYTGRVLRRDAGDLDTIGGAKQVAAGERASLGRRRVVAGSEGNGEQERAE